MMTALAYIIVEWYGMPRFAQHDNMGVITCHAERSEAESKHLRPPMPTSIGLLSCTYGLRL